MEPADDQRDAGPGPGGSGPPHGAVQPAERAGGGRRRRLLGRVTFDDVIDVVEAETTEDLLQFGGVSARRGAGRALERRRCGAGCRGSTSTCSPPSPRRVVLVFSRTRSRSSSALAVWMPIIAGMGGNAGTQALAVTVRRLALGLIPPAARRRHRRQGDAGRGWSTGSPSALVVGVDRAGSLGTGAQLGLVVVPRDDGATCWWPASPARSSRCCWSGSRSTPPSPPRSSSPPSPTSAASSCCWGSPTRFLV